MSLIWDFILILVRVDRNILKSNKQKHLWLSKFLGVLEIWVIRAYHELNQLHQWSWRMWRKLDWRKNMVGIRGDWERHEGSGGKEHREDWRRQIDQELQMQVYIRSSKRSQYPSSLSIHILPSSVLSIQLIQTLTLQIYHMSFSHSLLSLKYSLLHQTRNLTNICKEFGEFKLRWWIDWPKFA
jgi:hypothetical protein